MNCRFASERSACLASIRPSLCQLLRNINATTNLFWSVVHYAIALDLGDYELRDKLGTTQRRLNQTTNIAVIFYSVVASLSMLLKTGHLTAGGGLHT